MSNFLDFVLIIYTLGAVVGAIGVGLWLNEIGLEGADPFKHLGKAFVAVILWPFALAFMLLT